MAFFNFRTLELFTKLFKNNNTFKYIYDENYSTSIKKHFDVFEIFTTILLNRRDLSRNNFYSVISCKQKKKEKPEIKKIFAEGSSAEFDKKKGTSKVDKLIAEMNITNLRLSSKMLANELESNIERNNWIDVYKIIIFCRDKKVPLPDHVLLKLAENFANDGFTKGLMLLRTLYKTTNPEKYFRNEELLHYMAKCYWCSGNVLKCITMLKECTDKYPDVKNTTRNVINEIISQGIASQSEAVLLNIANFVKEYVEKHRDFYPMVVLWSNLFLSTWYNDQNSADKLLNDDENLRYCLSLLCPSLTRYLFKENMISDIYRLLQILLKYKMMKTYSEVLQISFDWFCSRGERYRCSEIIKNSVELNASLREEQYNQFIAWTVYGDPFKNVKKAEIKQIYSKF